MILKKIEKVNLKMISNRTKIGLRLLVFLTALAGVACGHEYNGREPGARLDLRTSTESINASTYMKYHIVNQPMSLNQIQDPKRNWINNKQFFFEQRFSPREFWFKLPVQNNTLQPTWYATLNNTRLNIVDFYLLDQNGVQSFKTGDNRPLSPGSPLAYPSFRFQLPPGQSAVLYFRVKTDSNISFSLNLHGSEAFGELKFENKLMHLLFAGLLVLFIVFQVRLNPTVKGVMEFYLEAAVIMGLFYFFCFFGEANRLLWPNSVFLKNMMIPLSALLFQLFFLLFLPNYLRTSELSPRLHLMFKIQTGLVAFLLPVIFLISSNYLRTFLISTSAILMFSLMIGGIISALRAGYHQVLFLTTSWIVFGIATLTFTLMIFGFFPYNIITANATLLVYPLELLSIIVSLVCRHRILAYERNNLREKVNELKKNSPAPSLEMQKQARIPDKIQEAGSTLGEQSNRRIQNIDGTRLLNELKAYFKEEQPYLEENLTMSQVAAFLDIRSDQLSALLNSQMNTSFSALVNEYRIREACRMIQEKPNTNLLNIAFDCGFGSRTSFNRVFKQCMDMAPVEFRRTQNETVLVENLS